MKLFILITLFTISLPTFAWREVVNCNNGEFVIDEEAGPRGGLKYQMALRGNVWTWFNKITGLDVYEEKNQYVFDLGVGYKDNITSWVTFRTPVEGQFQLSLRNANWNHSGPHLILQRGRQLDTNDYVSDYNFDHCWKAR